jgi:hypothetical protein
MLTRSRLPFVATVLLLAGSVLNAQTFDLSMPTGAARSLTTVAGGSTLNAGVAAVSANGPEVLPAGFALIRYRPNGVLISETSVPVAPITHFARIYVEVGATVNTGVAIANATAHPVTINFSFMDASGTVVKTGTTQLLPQARVRRFVNEAPFSLKGAFIGTMTIEADGPPVSIIAVRGFINERSEFLMSSVPVLEQGFGDLFLPHYADGGGWTTQVVLVNSTDQPVSGTFQFLNNDTLTGDNQPIEIAVDGQSDSSFAYAIPPGSARTFVTSGAPANVHVGSIRLIPVGRSLPPIGHVILSYKRHGTTVTQESVAGAPRRTLHRMYVEEDASQQIQTALAMFNPAQDNIAVELNLTDTNGQPTGLSATVGLAPFGHTAKFLREIPGFETLPPTFKGVLQIVTFYRFGASLVGLRTRYNERGDLLVSSTNPVPQFFDSGGVSGVGASPQVVSGAGYTTELVFFSVSPTGADEFPTGGSLSFIEDTANTIEFIPPLN